MNIRTIGTIVLRWMSRNISSVALIALIIYFTLQIRSCVMAPSTTAAGETGVSWIFFLVAFFVLIWAIYATREKKEATYILAGLTFLDFLYLLAKLTPALTKLNELFAWDVLGLPALVGFGIWGYLLVPAGSRMRSFIGVVSGAMAILWMFLLYRSLTTGIKIEFMKLIFVDDVAKAICAIFLAVLIFAIWQESKICKTIAFVLFLAFIGDTMFQVIVCRFPTSLTPPKEISEGAGSLLKSAGKAMKRLSAEIDNPTTTTTTLPTQKPANIVQPASQSVAPAKKQQQVQKEALSALRQELAATAPTPPPQQVAPVSQTWVADIEWPKGSDTRFIRNLSVTQKGDSLELTSYEMIMTATGTDGEHYSGNWHDNTGKKGTFTANIKDNVGQFGVGQRFTLVRR